LFEVSFMFPFAKTPYRNQRICHWSLRILNILHIELRVIGSTADWQAKRRLIVANHVSWLDIFVMNGGTVARFVAKSEVRQWPAIGWLCAAAGTLFIDRSSRQAAREMNKQLLSYLEAGEQLAIFPEGTTSDGTYLKPFTPSLLQPALDARCPIQPIALRYCSRNGEYNAAAAYIDEMTLVESIIAIMREPDLCAELHLLPPILCNGTQTRQVVVKQVETQIADALGVKVRTTTPVPLN
jgi:1-acyl-sn-glycerol-3-phosphate acyltransferase